MKFSLPQALQMSALFAGICLALGCDDRIVIAAALIGLGVGDDLHVLARLVREVSRKRKA